MEHYRALSVVIAALTIGTATKWLTAAAEDRPNAEEAAVKAVLDVQATAWNKGDLDGFMAGYQKTETLIFISGDQVRKGWEETRARYKKTYQADGKEMGKLTFSELVITPIDANSMLVYGRYDLLMAKEMANGRFTLLMKKLPEGWRIVHDHTSKAC